jgi:hypothetical protein
MRTGIKGLITAIILALFTPLAIPNAEAAVLPGVGIPTTGLQLYFDAANINSYPGSGVTLTDLSGNGNTGTLVASPSYTHTSSGGFFTFADGGQSSTSSTLYQHVTLSTFNPSFTNGLTISFYGSFGSIADSYERILDFGNGSANQNIIFGRDWTSNNIYYESYNGGGSRGRCTSSGGITTGIQLWTVVVSSAGCNIYSGSSTTPVGSSASNLIPTDLASPRSNMYIGRSNWGDNYFGGSMYRLAIYNRAINVSTELATLATSMTDTSWPTLSGSDTYTVSENSSAVALLTATESSSFLESTGSGNYSVFSVSSNGNVTFDSAPNFESPNPSNTLTYYFYITDPNGNSRIQVITVYVRDVQEYATITTPSLSATPYKGVNVTITVTPSTAANIAGKVTFLWNGKRIPKCFNKAYSGSSTSTCVWKPASMGYEQLSVTFTPNKTNGLQEFAAATSTLTPFVVKRTTTR